MKISVIGGGPGGLYFSILTKKAMPSCEIHVYERNRADDAFGFGVVFSDETLSEFLMRDPDSYELIRSSFAYWDDLDVVRNGERVRISGNGFCGCSRKTLLQLLQQRCREVGVNLHFEHNINDVCELSDSDIIVACDGINSSVRDKFSAEFGTHIEMQRNRFVWLGSTKPLDAFAYFFRKTPQGAIVAHTYQYEKGHSTWIFECAPDTWDKLGFDTFDEQGTMEKLAAIFEDELDGHPLISNKSHWRNFPEVVNKNWHYQNIVLLGDAKATAHYSIGSGTKLAMECAIALSDSIVANPNNVNAAFAMYEKLRRNRVEMIQHAARVSLDWFENMDRHMQHPFLQFAFGVMTRAKKVTLENLRLRDSSFTDKVLEEFHGHPSHTPAAFTPFSIDHLKLENRIAMIGTPQGKAVNGCATDWHLMHYGSRAVSGVGLVITEPVYVSENNSNDLTLVNENQLHELKRIIDFIHMESSAKVAIRLAFDGDALSANPVQLAEMFATSAKLAEQAGIDLILIDAGPGTSLSKLLSPLTAPGTIEERVTIPLKIFSAVKQAVRTRLGVTLVASDRAEGGISTEDVIFMARAFKDAGASFINVTTGGIVPHESPKSGRMYQTPHADLVRNTVGIPVMTSGSITDIDQINTILLTGRADIVILGKRLLLDPGFVRNAQAYETYVPNDVPEPYQSGVKSLLHLRRAERREKESMKKALKPESHKKSEP